VLGVLMSPSFFAAGFFLHGLRDLVHYNGSFGARVPQWSIPFCAAIDRIKAIMLAGLFLVFPAA
jgi:hypothetical protein|tara:strand:- start:6152 stop:6343 length:192 start_codon:yes stop_codon:yes gene_type:complete